MYPWYVRSWVWLNVYRVFKKFGQYIHFCVFMEVYSKIFIQNRPVNNKNNRILFPCSNKPIMPPLRSFITKNQILNQIIGKYMQETKMDILSELFEHLVVRFTPMTRSGIGSPLNRHLITRPSPYFAHMSAIVRFTPMTRSGIGSPLNRLLVTRT